MELRQLRYFAAAARRRHFTAAAAALHVAQPALSQQIRGLEREIGVELFDRTGRRVRLTPAGEALLIHAERVLTAVARAETAMAEFAGLLRGRVVVGALPSLAEHQLPALLAGFHARYPGLELALREERTAQLLVLLAGGEIDLAILHQSPAADPPADVILEPLFTEELVAVVAPDKPLAARGALPLAALRDEPFVTSQPGSAIRHTLLQAAAAAGFTPRIAFESGGAATVRALAAAGLGVAILPRSEAVAAGPPVAVLAIDPPDLTRTVALAWSTGHYRPAATAAFLAFARDALRRPPAPA